MEPAQAQEVSSHTQVNDDVDRSEQDRRHPAGVHPNAQKTIGQFALTPELAPP